MKSYFLNRIDEQGRFVGLKVSLGNKEGQDDTHTYSYMQVRNTLTEMNPNFGLTSDDFNLETILSVYKNN